MTSERGESRFGKNLLWRVTIAVIFIPVFLWVSYRGGVLFFLYVELLIILGMREFLNMMKSKGFRVNQEISMLLAVACGVLFFLCPVSIGKWTMIFVMIVLGSFLLHWLFSKPGDSSLVDVGLSIFGVMYVGLLFSHQVLLRESPEFFGKEEIVGWYYILFPYFLVWISDTSAYFIGKFFGKHPLAPRTSPGKTIEGAVAGFIFSLCTAVAFYLILPEFLSLKDVLILGFLIAIICQVGDMIESRMKREIGVKDASSIIPGHGGILDRYDGILVSVPVVYYYLVWGSPVPVG